MEVADVRWWIFQRQRAHFEMRVRDMVNELNFGRFEERHWEIAREMHAITVVADIHRQGFDEILAAIAVVEGACAEKKRDGRVDRSVCTIVPGNPNATAP